MSRLSIYVFCGWLLLVACKSNVVYDETVPIKDRIWSYEHPVDFEFSISDTIPLYSIYLNLKHAENYTFQNIYVKITTSFPDGNSKEDIVSLELATKNGLWNGSCGGGNCSVEIPLQEKTFFQQSGKYSLSIEQYMRQDNLKGIHSINLQVQTEPT